MPKKILLADDSITIQKVVELTFSDGDYEVVAMNNGAKAIARLSEIRPDIILSDIIMPEKNGYEVCEYVKSHPEFRHIPVILLTGTFEPFDPDRAEKAGCDAVVTKPFESQSLIHKVEELIAQSRQGGGEDTPQAAGDAPFPDEMPDIVHDSPTYEMPAFTPGETFGGGAASFDAPAAGAPFEDEEPAADAFESSSDADGLSDPFSAPPSFESESQAPAFREHSSELFGNQSNESDGSGLPLAAPASWGDSESEVTPAEEAPLFSPTPQAMPSMPPWNPPPEDLGATKMIPKLTMDDIRAMSAAAAPEPETHSAFGGESPSSLPFESTDNFGQQEDAPSLFGEESSPEPVRYSAEPEAETSGFTSFDDRGPGADEAAAADDAGAAEFGEQQEPAFNTPAQSPFEEELSGFDAPSNDFGGAGETKMIPRLSFDDIQRMRAEQDAPSAPIAPIPLSPMDEEEEAEILPFDAPSTSSMHTSEQPFEQEFEPEYGTEDETPQAAGTAASSPFTGDDEAVEEEVAPSPLFAAEEPEADEPPLTFPSEVPALSEAPSWEEPAVEAAAASPLWSATEPESITPEPAPFSAPAALAPVELPTESSRGNAAEGATLDASALSDEVIDRIARRVVELMSQDIIRKIAWEVVPDTAEMIVKERIRQLENEA